jgi:hypothetical protein
LAVEEFYFSFFPLWLNLSHFNLNFPQQDCFFAEWHVIVDVPKPAFGRGCVQHGAPFMPDCVWHRAPFGPDCVQQQAPFGPDCVQQQAPFGSDCV